MVRRQPIERPAEIHPPRDGVSGWIRLPFLAGRRRALAVDDGVLGSSGRPTEMIDARGRHDAVHPGAEPGVAPEVGDAPERSDVGVLEGVVHCRPVTQHPVCHRSEPLVVEADEAFEGRSITGAGALEEISLGGHGGFEALAHTS